MVDAEQALVIRSRSGDRAAFEELVRATARGLFSRIYLQTADKHRTEDLVQETFLRAWKKLDSLSDPKLFRGWLNSIAHGVVIDAAKRDSRKKRGTAKQDEQAMQQVVAGDPSPPTALEQAEQQQHVLSILKSLPPEYQDVLSLRYLAGADYATIAKQLAISNGSLRGLLSRGMKLLRERLETNDQ